MYSSPSVKKQIPSPSILILGTCRVYRPFARLLPPYSEPDINLPAKVKIIFPRLGYFHTSSEIGQILRFIRNPSTIPAEIREYVFRIEPTQTTPLNEFDSRLDSSMRSKTETLLGDANPFKELTRPDFILAEFSSVHVNFCRNSGIFFHHNPNLRRNAAYGDYQPNGYFATYHPEMDVVRIEETIDKVAENLASIKAFATKDLFVCGHLTPTVNPNHKRLAQNLLIKQACNMAGVRYIEMSGFVDHFGFLQTPSGIDIHHLSNEGEVAFGKHIESLTQGREFTNSI